MRIAKIKSIVVENLLTETIVEPQGLSIGYFPSLNGLRALSIIMVVIGHILVFKMGMKEGVTLLFFNGGLGVNIFFVISGFIITSLLLKEKIRTNNISLKRFYVRRFLRIFPVAFAFVLLLILLNAIFSLQITKTSFLTAITFLKNLPFEDGTEWWSGHYWSLSVEEQFYLLFPFLLQRSIKNYVFIILTLLFVTPVLAFLYHEQMGLVESNIYIHRATTAFLILFGNGTTNILVGSLFSILLFKNQFAFLLSSHGKFAILLIELSLFGLIFVLGNSLCINSYIASFLFPFSIAFLIIFQLYQRSGILYFLLNTKWITTVGILSYSTYIWQQIFTAFQPWANSFLYGGSVLLNVVFLIITVFCSYYLVEKPFLKLKERFS